ncbi:MAG: hypothetical protein LBK50_00220 [Candidatus Nomurabacteria bacterium]|nr:hypothetical protein [Candidatus Nomurabacteria bacterium]
MKNTRFSISDWVVVIVISALVLAGIITGAYFGVRAYLNSQIDQMNSEASEEVGFDDELTRGSEILDLYVNKKSGVVLFFDNKCLADDECSDYLTTVAMMTGMMKAGAPELFMFNPETAVERGDSNIDVALTRAGVSEYPTLLIVRDGRETGRYTGFDMSEDEMFALFIDNNLLDEDVLEALAAEADDAEYYEDDDAEYYDDEDIGD